MMRYVTNTSRSLGESGMAGYTDRRGASQQRTAVLCGAMWYTWTARDVAEAFSSSSGTPSTRKSQ